MAKFRKIWSHWAVPRQQGVNNKSRQPQQRWRKNYIINLTNAYGWTTTGIILYKNMLPQIKTWQLFLCVVGRGHEPWFSGYGRTLMIKRSRVQIQVKCFSLLPFKIPSSTNGVWKDRKNEKESGIGLYLFNLQCGLLSFVILNPRCEHRGYTLTAKTQSCLLQRATFNRSPRAG